MLELLRLLRCELWKLKRKRFVQLVIAAAFLFPVLLTFFFMNWDPIPEVLELLRLLRCELWKLKRKRFVQLVIAAAFLFPVLLTFFFMNWDPIWEKCSTQAEVFDMMWQSVLGYGIQLFMPCILGIPVLLTFFFMNWDPIWEKCSTQAEVFDMMWQSVLGYGIQLFMPCILGIVAALLFFMERDNDTFKSLKTIPISSTKLVLAKVILLFLFSIVFCAASTIASVFCGGIVFEVQGIVKTIPISSTKLVLAKVILLFLFSIVFCAASTIASVFCGGIVFEVQGIGYNFCSKSYIFSIFLCVFYSVLNEAGAFVMGALPKAVVYLMPVPLTTLWSADDMQKHMAISDPKDLQAFGELIPSEMEVVIILFIIAFISVFFMIKLYQRRGE